MSLDTLTMRAETFRPRVRIRAATDDDTATLVEIIHAAYEEFRGWLVPPSGAHGETVESVRAKLARGGGLVALAGEDAVGSLLHEPRGEGLYVGRVAVLPAFRRFGIGRMLMEQAETVARSQGRRFVTLGVRLQLAGNFAFYRSLGYVVVEEGCHPGFEVPTFARMEKRLDV